MTLYRQILTITTLLFAGLLIAVFYIQFRTTTDYLQAQLESDVANTLTATGLALQPYLQNNDAVGAESVINAMFDGGFYQNIKLDLFASKHVIERSLPVTVDGVPGWFTQLKLFRPVIKDEVITSGWLQLARLELAGHPGFAYQQLWQASVSLLTWFIFGFAVASWAMIRLLRVILRPLAQIQQHAEGISKRQFGEPIPLPKMREMRPVVNAINGMSVRLAQIFKQQAQEAAQLRERAFQDAVSGLGNRAYLAGQVDAWIAEQGQGALVLIGVPVLEQVYRDEGYEARDSLVRSMAEVLTQQFSGQSQIAIARIAATEFALLLPAAEGDVLNELLEGLSAKLNALIVDPLAVTPVQLVHIGAVERSQEANLGALLAHADQALQTAQRDHLTVNVIKVNPATVARGRIAWRELVEQALLNKNLVFKAQPAIACNDGSVLHYELLASIVHEGHSLSAAQFMPAIEQFRLGAAFDKQVVQQAVNLALQHQWRLAVNLSLSALQDSDFRQWLLAFVESSAAIKRSLVFEVPEQSCLASGNGIREFIEQLLTLDVCIGVDHYGRNFQSLDYIAWLKPEYVKLDHGYSSHLLGNEVDRNFIAAAAKTAANLGICTIATRIENQQQLVGLPQLGIDGYQGYISPPKDISSCVD